MSAEKDPIEDIFKNRFEGFDDEPGEAAWEGIRAGVSKKKKTRRALVVLFVFISIASYSTYKVLNTLGVKASVPGNITLHSKPVNTSSPAVPSLASEIPVHEAAGIVQSKQTDMILPAGIHAEQSFIDKQEPVQQYENPEQSFSIITPAYTAVYLPDYSASLYKPVVLYSFNSSDKNDLRSSFRLSSIGIDAAFAMLAVPGEATKALQKSTAVNMQFRITDRLSLTGGIGIQQMQVQGFRRSDRPYSYIYDSVLVMDNKRQVSYFKFYDTVVTTQRTKLTHTYTSVILPLGVDYMLGNKGRFRFGIGAGVQLGKVVSGNIYNTEVPEIGSKKQDIDFDETATLLKTYTAQMSYRLSVSYKTGAHTGFTLYPEYTYMLSKTQVVGKTNTGHLSGYGLRAAYTYSF